MQVVSTHRAPLQCVFFSRSKLVNHKETVQAFRALLMGPLTTLTCTLPTHLAVYQLLSLSQAESQIRPTTWEPEPNMEAFRTQ